MRLHGSIHYSIGFAKKSQHPKSCIPACKNPQYTAPPEFSHAKKQRLLSRKTAHYFSSQSFARLNARRQPKSSFSRSALSICGEKTRSLSH